MTADAGHELPFVIEQRGKVTGLEGDKAWVRIGGQSGCPACDAGQGCGAGLFGKLLNRSDARILIDNDALANAGDVVVLGLDESDYLALVVRLYGLPLVAGLGGAMLAVLLFGPSFQNDVVARDVIAGTAGIVSAAAAALISRRNLPDRFTRLSPKMLDTINEIGLECTVSDSHSEERSGP